MANEFKVKNGMILNNSIPVNGIVSGSITKSNTNLITDGALFDVIYSSFTNISGNYTILSTDDIILLNPLSSSLTAILPDASTLNSGKKYHIKRILDNSNSILVSGFGNQTIDGINTQEIDGNNSMNIVTNRATWYII